MGAPLDSLTRSISLGSVTMVLEDLGRGPPLLLLHGFPATRALWSKVSGPLAALGFRVLVPDLIGYGSSEAPAGVRLDMASQARWLLQLLDALHIEQVALIAHDVGSAAAQLMLVQAPERLRCLVVLDGVYAGEWAMEAIASIRDWKPEEAARLKPVLARRLGKTPGLAELLEVYAGESGGQRLIRAARDLDPAQTGELFEVLQRQRVPALVLWGATDRYLPIETVARPLAQLLGAPLKLLPGGHFTPLDCPAEVTAALGAFLVAGAPAPHPGSP